MTVTIGALAELKSGLVVSCQAPEGDPLHGPATMSALARAAVSGGAVGIRANGPADVAAIRRAVDVPVIGLYKVDLPDSPVRITPTLDLALEIAAAGATIIAVDATARPRPEPLDRLIPAIRERTDLPILADVASIEEALAAVALGADAVSTTMSGYTGQGPPDPKPDLGLVAKLVDNLDVPVIAEGRITVPNEARRAIELGAFAVVVGTAITRPEAITRRFADAVATATRDGRRSELSVAIDIGGTKIAGAIVDGTGCSLARMTVPTPAEDAAAVLAAVVELGRSLVAASPRPPVACGVATAGEVDSLTGRIVSSTSALGGWAGFPLGPKLQEALGLPVVVENDGNSAALAEARVGAGRGAGSVLSVTVGTGIGGGVVTDGRIHRGQHGVAGGVGHAVAHPNGRRCLCGSRGCIEAYASGPAIVRSFREAVRRKRAGVTVEGRKALENVVAMASSRDDRLGVIAQRSIDGAALDLGTVLGGLVNVLDPDVVVLGGGVVAGVGDSFVDAVRAAIRAQTLPPARDVLVRSAALGPLSAAVGAGLLALDAARERRE